MPSTYSNTGRIATFCGVDLGSTNTKVILLSDDGTVVRRECCPTPRAADLSLDADSILDCVEGLIIAACDDRFCIHSIAVAGIGEDGVLLDVDLAPLCPALTWFDPRRVDLFNSIRPRLADLPDTGTTLDAARTVVGWAWAMGQPGAARAHTWVALTDYLAVKWTGKVFMSDTLAARTAAWSVTRCAWHDINVHATLGRMDRLPAVVATGDVIGPLYSRRLQAAGVLGADAIVVAGGHDHPIGGWGISQLDASAVLDSMGTAEVVVGQSSSPALPVSKQLDIAAGIRHSGLTLLSVTELARNIEWASREEDVAWWIQRIVAGERQPNADVYSDLFEPGGPGGGRPCYNTSRRIDGLSKASATLGALARLGSESVRTVANRMTSQASIYAAGGWARAPGWMTLKEQSLEASIQIVPEQEVTAVSAGLLGAKSCGVHGRPETSFALGQRR